MRILLIAMVLISTDAYAAGDLDAAFENDVLVIEASAHACHRFDVYVAKTAGQHARGLMFVRDLAATTGMLFVYEDANYLSMWMKNTYISLDIVFARSDGTVSSIAHDTEPLSLRSIAATEPVMYVLELNAGTAKRLFIDEDSRLLWGPMYGYDE